MCLAPASSPVSNPNLLPDQSKINADFLSSRPDRKLRSLRKSPHCLVSHFARLQCAAILLPSSCHLQPQTRYRRLLLRAMARSTRMHPVYSHWSTRGSSWRLKILPRCLRPEHCLCRYYCSLGTRYAGLHRYIMEVGQKFTR